MVRTTSLDRVGTLGRHLMEYGLRRELLDSSTTIHQQMVVLVIFTMHKMLPRCFFNQLLHRIGTVFLLVGVAITPSLNGLEPPHKEDANSRVEQPLDGYKNSAEFAELLQIGIKNGFVGKDGFKLIIARLDYGMTNKSSKLGFDGEREIQPQRDKIEEAAFLFGLEYCDQKKMQTALLIHGRPFKSENIFYRILDQRLRMQTDSKTPLLESIALRQSTFRCIYTSGGMFSEPIHRISDILEVGRLESFKKPAIANQILRQLWHVVDGPKSYYDPTDTKEALRFIALESTADEEAVNNILLRLICPELAQEIPLTQYYKPQPVSWKSEASKAVIWYLHQIRNDNLRARTVLNAVKGECKRQADWIQQIEAGKISEEVGFTIPLKESRIAKDRFEAKATEEYRKRFKK